MVTFANAINRPSLEKIVYSKTLERVDWNARLVREIVPDEVRALKAQGNGTISIAGGKIGVAFTRLGLVDELELLVHPVVLDGGKRLFEGIGKRFDLKLMSTKTFQSGVVVMRYAVA
jgi:dihydrofolate reductase